MGSDEDLEARVDRIQEAVEGLAEAVEMLVDGREPDEIVERVDTGASLRSELTRGTGTRDQEKHRIYGKGADAAEALEEYEEMLEAVEEEYADRVRGLQPVEEPDEDDG